jgi:membrane associated rhomboid family serine protease
MFALYLFGNIIEYKIKSKDFILLYLLSIILSGIVSILFLIYFSSNPSFIIGASGAIFGIWAFYSFYTDTVRDFLIYFLIYHVFIFVLGMNIAWYSHLGGSIAGILFWFLYYNKKRKIGGMFLWR